MKLDHFYYATHYYRAPSPLEEEWEEDLANLSKYHLNTIQIRINWRNNERREDEYDFSDIDKLLELAHKYNKKVFMKFVLECAPQYIFDKYKAYRIGPKGEVFRGGYHSAFYGGWLPCYTKPAVRERMKKFVFKVAERYHSNPDIVLWNVWNEPRNRPAEECFCEDCRKKYGEYLKHKFGTIENLNKFYGSCEESFEHIALPATPQGYWDTFEFKKFKSEQQIFDNLKLVYDAIRTFDKERPIVSHVGFTAALQFTLDDCINDDFVSKAVDFWGTSTACECDMSKEENRLDFSMLNDFLRSICKDYLLYELYPGLGSYKYSYDTNFDMKYKLYDALGSGAKLINFWQYRSERIGSESDCAGLARMDGSPREVLNEVRDFGEIVEKIGDNVKEFSRKQADIAILFDYDSSLISEIEDANGPLYKFDNVWWILYYRYAHAGFYRLAKRNDYDVDYVQTSKVKDIHNYKVIYAPYYAMISKEVANELEKFVANGGILIADEGFGLRDPNTWVNPYDIKCSGLFKARIVERRRDDRGVTFNGKQLLSKGYHSVYKVENSEVFGMFSDGSPSIQRIKHGKGMSYLFGFSLGYNAFHSKDKILSDVFESILDNKVAKNKYSSIREGLEARELDKDNESYFTFLNSSSKPQVVKLDKNILSSFGNIKTEDNKITIEPHGCGIIKAN